MYNSALLIVILNWEKSSQQNYKNLKYNLTQRLEKTDTKCGKSN